MVDRDVLIDRGFLMKEIMDRGHHKTGTEITAKWLGMELGLSDHTIRKYIRGELNPDLHVWARLYQLTRDRRIPELLTGNVEVMILDLPEDFSTDMAFMQRLTATITSHAKHVEAVMAILADGKIDARDRNLVIALRDNLETVMRAHFQSVHGIIARYEANTGRRKL